jgi:hypothetical protein
MKMYVDVGRVRKGQRYVERMAFNVGHHTSVHAKVCRIWWYQLLPCFEVVLMPMRY